MAFGAVSRSFRDVCVSMTDLRAPLSAKNGPVAGRKPFLDNTRLLLAGILALVVVLAGLLALATRSSAFAPDVLAEVVLYALSATNLTILLALLFVLARNIVKLVVERRRGLPFSRFRAKMVGALLGLTIVPALLGLLVRDRVRLATYRALTSASSRLADSPSPVDSPRRGDRSRRSGSPART